MLASSAESAQPMSVGTITPIRGHPILPLQDPRTRFPAHARFLEAHLVGIGEDPRHWVILEAEESRLDEDGMEVRFSLLRQQPAKKLMFRWVLVRRGTLVAVDSRAGAGR